MGEGERAGEGRDKEIRKEGLERGGRGGGGGGGGGAATTSPNSRPPTCAGMGEAASGINKAEGGEGGLQQGGS